MKAYLLLTIMISSINLSLASDNHPCFSKIKKSICVTASEFNDDPTLSPVENLQRKQNQRCVEDPSDYLHEIQAIFKDLPSQAKNAFCYIERIYIVPGDVKMGAWAQLMYEITNRRRLIGEQEVIEIAPIGFMLSISKKYRFDLKESEAQFRSRQLQQNFGINVFENGLDPKLPIWHEKGKQTSSLYHTILHEIGHFIDYANQLTNTRIGLNEFGENVFTSDWSDISWTSPTVDNFRRTPKIPASARKEPAPEDFRESIIDILDSGFISYYSLSSVREDFAESYSYFKSRNIWELVNGDEVLYSSAQSYSYQRLEEKRELIEDLEDDPFANLFNQGNHVIYTNSPSQNIGEINSHCRQSI